MHPTLKVRKNFLSQLRQVDNGDNSARMHEVINQTIREVRENSKFASTMRSDLEKFYKDFRGDLMEVADKMKTNNPQSTTSDEDDGQVIDSKKLNDMIDEAKKKTLDLSGLVPDRIVDDFEKFILKRGLTKADAEEISKIFLDDTMKLKESYEWSPVVFDDPTTIKL